MQDLKINFIGKWLVVLLTIILFSKCSENKGEYCIVSDYKVDTNIDSVFQTFELELKSQNARQYLIVSLDLNLIINTRNELKEKIRVSHRKEFVNCLLIEYFYPENDEIVLFLFIYKNENIILYKYSSKSKKVRCFDEIKNDKATQIITHYLNNIVYLPDPCIVLPNSSKLELGSSIIFSKYGHFGNETLCRIIYDCWKTEQFLRESTNGDINDNNLNSFVLYRVIIDLNYLPSYL